MRWGEGYGFRVPGYGLRVTGYELRVTSSGFNIMGVVLWSEQFKAQSCVRDALREWVTGYELGVPGSDILLLRYLPTEASCWDLRLPS
jgi:hypothetical protein